MRHDTPPPRDGQSSHKEEALTLASGYEQKTDRLPRRPVVTSCDCGHVSSLWLMLQAFADNLGYRWKEWRGRHDDLYVALERLNQ